MRKVLVAAALVALTGCHKVKQESRATPTDSSVRLDIASDGPITKKSGVLIVPVKLTNRRDRFVQVFLDRCECEDTNGDRRHRRSASQTTALCGPGRTEKFKLIFGDSGAPLVGESFRIWLWIQQTDGSGIVDGVPPLVFGSGSFAKPAQPYAKAAQAPDMLPPPTEAPPRVENPPPGTELAPCSTCGEPRPKGSATCPHCGLP